VTQAKTQIGKSGFMRFQGPHACEFKVLAKFEPLRIGKER